MAGLSAAYKMLIANLYRPLDDLSDHHRKIQQSPLQMATLEPVSLFFDKSLLAEKLKNIKLPLKQF